MFLGPGSLLDKATARAVSSPRYEGHERNITPINLASQAHR
jgi:hypothetical protein